MVTITLDEREAYLLAHVDLTAAKRRHLFGVVNFRGRLYDQILPQMKLHDQLDSEWRQIPRNHPELINNQALCSVCKNDIGKQKKIDKAKRSKNNSRPQRTTTRVWTA